jgi:hypothetical protein
VRIKHTFVKASIERDYRVARQPLRKHHWQTRRRWEWSIVLAVLLKGKRPSEILNYSRRKEQERTWWEEESNLGEEEARSEEVDVYNVQLLWIR